jgi:hypothetical protein
LFTPLYNVLCAAENRLKMTCFLLGRVVAEQQPFPARKE